MARPALTRITSVYGYSEQYGTKFHGGIDFANADRRVFAYAAGTVVSVGWVSGWAGLGLVVIIDHGYGIQSWSCHLAGSLVQVGDWVAAGQHVATMGNSATTDVHLHWEIRINGVRADPTPYLTSTAGGSSIPFDPEENDMSRLNNIYIAYQEDDGRQINVVFNPESGFWSPFESNDGGYNTEIAAVFGIPVTKPVSKSHALAIERACAAVRAGEP